MRFSSRKLLKDFHQLSNLKQIEQVNCLSDFNTKEMFLTLERLIADSFVPKPSFPFTAYERE
jgi:hypothetical protein